MKDSPKFIATDELGRLARWLRLLGYDCAFFDKGQKKDLVVKSLREDRVILTRSAAMARFSGVRIIRVTSDFVEEQLEQVVKNLHLAIDREKMFTRCVECDTPIEKVAKEDVRERVPPHVYTVQEEFMRCPHCDKIYWKGSHLGLANDFLNKVKYE